jgi:hypothetical protein
MSSAPRDLNHILTIYPSSDLYQFPKRLNLYRSVSSSVAGGLKFPFLFLYNSSSVYVLCIILDIIPR